MDVTAKDLRYRTGQVLRSVRRGARPRVTHRGRPVARLVPLAVGADEPFRDIGFGMWKGRRDLKDVGQWLDGQRAPRRRR